METEIINSNIVRRQTLELSISRACKECGAPGVFQRDQSYIEKYPEVYRPAWAGRVVGAVCPHCGLRRPEAEQLGEVWKQEWKAAGFFRRLWNKMKG